MSGIEWAFDGVLALALALIAWRALTVREHFQAVVLFITFGLLMALAWVRLGALDVALAEAAIGAGLTGVLLLDALHHIGRVPRAGEEAGEKTMAAGAARPETRRVRLLPWLGAAGLAFVLGLTVLALPRERGGLTEQVEAMLHRSGVEHPVTAVLLNFRGYDTWMELGVLLLALLGVLCVRGELDLARERPAASPGEVLGWLVRWLTPVLVLVAGYLLWLGKTASGGAFQAGVVLGAAGVLLWLAGEPTLERLPGLLWRGLAVLGFTVFLAAGAATLLAGGHWLEYPPERAGLLILLIESAAAVSIGCTLAGLFAAMRFTSGVQPSPSSPSGMPGPAREGSWTST